MSILEYHRSSLYNINFLFRALCSQFWAFLNVLTDISLSVFNFPNMHPATEFHREIVSEMGDLGVLGPTIKGKQKECNIINMVRQNIHAQVSFVLPGF